MRGRGGGREKKERKDVVILEGVSDYIRLAAFKKYISDWQCFLIDIRLVAFFKKISDLRRF